MNLEIWFPQQNEVTVFLESSIVDPDEEQSVESCLFTLYAARQIANLNGSERMTLAQFLYDTDTSDPLAQTDQRLGGVRVSSPVSRGGRKGFTVEMRPDKRMFFKLNPHGFGMLGKGIGYYAPTSTMALLYWLLKRREDDPTYQRALSAAAENIGIAGLQGMITVASQATIAMQAASAAWGEAFEAEREDEFEPPEGLDLSSLSVSWGVLVSSSSAALQALFEDVPEGQTLVFADEQSVPFCGLQVLAAAGIRENEEVTRAYAAVEAAADKATVAAANTHLQEVVVEALEEHGLTAVAEALHEALFTSHADRALHGES